MVATDKTVFLSYRREVSWATAHLVRNDLVQNGFDVFMDVHGIDSGEFDRVILHEIETRTHFLVLLEARSLDRIVERGDWLRREVAHALTHSRNVVPITAGGFRLPRASELPDDVARLASLNALSVPPDYVAEAMQKLRTRFLTPVAVRAAPATDGARHRRAEPARRFRRAEPTPRLGSSPRLVVKVESDANVLRWTPVVAAAEYEVQRSRSQTFQGAAEVYRGGALAVTDRRTAPVGWHYRVRAHDSGGRSGPWSPAEQAR